MTQGEAIRNARHCIQKMKDAHSYHEQRVGILRQPQTGSMHDPPTTYAEGEVILCRPAGVAGYYLIESPMPPDQIEAEIAKRKKFFTTKKMGGVFMTAVDVDSVEDGQEGF